MPARAAADDGAGTDTGTGKTPYEWAVRSEKARETGPSLAWARVVCVRPGEGPEQRAPGAPGVIVDAVSSSGHSGPNRGKAPLPQPSHCEGDRAAERTEH